MAQSYQAQKHYTSEVENEYFVMSARCRYEVWIESDEITLRGPGVHESSDREEIPSFISHEDLAIYIVLMFENGLWPRE